MFEYFVKKLSKDNRGFTLIELVVVIAILGILAAIAVPKIAGTTDKAAISAHNANVRTLESAANMYIAEEGLPSTNLDKDVTKSVLNGKYIQEWPKVPRGLKIGETTYEGTEEYEVTISTEGVIVVSPVKQ
ncbi:type II secretion system protein [Sporanaerobacter acetigenes]|uniref:type II secretion system protein n=1 Tax=Sporanaerobacter acetigenes TaxID=165813 RepID=UPI001044732A|nr:prepilin-type N-terminal cleavage/methylation domain-containing protein [Sporanaerobacter acetigenes]